MDDSDLIRLTATELTQTKAQLAAKDAEIAGLQALNDQLTAELDALKTKLQEKTVLTAQDITDIENPAPKEEPAP